MDTGENLMDGILSLWQQPIIDTRYSYILLLVKSSL